MRSIASLWILVVLPPLVGCNAEAKPVSVQLRDSAGVSIAVSAAPQWAAGEEWTLDSVPALNLGGPDTAYAFSYVVGAHRLPDGGVAVVDLQAHLVRFFDARGVPTGSVGRAGEGPGEFSQVASVSAFRGDSLLVFDRWLRRMTILDDHHRLGRVATFQSELMPTKLLPLPDGSAISTTVSLDKFSQLEGDYRLEYTVLRASPDGEILDTLARLPGPLGHKENTENGYTDFAPLIIFDGQLSTNGTDIVMGPADHMEFGRYALDGRLLQIARVPSLDVPYPSEEIEAERAAMLTPRSSAKTRERVARLPAPAMRPAYDDLIVDPMGFVWAAGYRGKRTQADEPVTWYVFDPKGAWLGTVTTPARFTVLEIGSDYLLGTTHDDLDAQQVQVLTLRRKAAA